MLEIRLTSIMVDDQDKALGFYTDVLGFQKKMDFPVGGPYRWITVAAATNPDVQLSLEPNVNAKDYQKSLFDQSIPATAFHTSDIDAEYKRLVDKGVAFTKPPTMMGPVKAAVFSDTVGNLIQIYQPMM